MRNHYFLAFLFLIFSTSSLIAQANDECAGATVISDPSDFCSPDPGENNALATASPQPFPSCFANLQADVWYTFTAEASELIFILRGFTPSNPTGTMQGPQVALYSGDCNNLVEIACSFDQFFTNVLPVTASGLVPGQQYFIRIDAIIPGSFQYCIKNQENLNQVSGDCPTAAIVCSKSPLQVESVFGGGNDPNEISDALCFQGLAGETTSAWFVFTAATNGTLEFTLTPTDPIDDLDFVVYRLPNGPGDCSDKEVQRCMAAGDFTPTSPCMGPTGLNATATDVAQPPGCAPGMDNFLRFMNLIAGETYALVVNNFTTPGNGFTIDWGGTAEFKGTPNAGFFTDATDQLLCLGEDIIFTDTSSVANGTIVNWTWDFGNGAAPDSAFVQGPVTMQYTTTGPKIAILTIETDGGCVAQDTALFFVQICCNVEITSVEVTPGCPDDPAAIATVSIDNGLDPLTITWSDNLSDSTSAVIDSSGSYYVLVEDANGCTDSLAFDVVTPYNLSATFPPDTSILLGETVTLDVDATPADEVVIWWISPTSDTLPGAPIGLSPEETTTYWVVAAYMGCYVSDSVTVVVEEPRFQIPNAFSPNGDGANDKFGPVNIGYTFVRMEVWSRWGDKIFDSEIAGSQTWDGTINGEQAPSDVYVYRIRYITPDGTETHNAGEVTLVR
ncbi:MAG: gliding motility-associated C-terminal domain-containing protein [Saprospiraceae bacterium]|nr:gliding motility-associated C-terminal domain-containing protein [Saprospiraceae bacterium]